MDKQKIRGYCLVSAFTVVLYLALSNLNRLSGALRVAADLLMPFFVGVAIAFVLNNVMAFFEEKVFYRLAQGKNPRAARMVRPLSLISTYLLTFAAFGVLLWVVVPQLAASIVTLGNNIPAYLESLKALGSRLEGEISLPAEALEQISVWFSQAADALLNFLVDFFPRMLGYIVSFGGGVVTFVIGIVVSIHLLMGKEKLLSQVRRLGRAFLPERTADWLGGAARVSVETFGNYVSGQLLDAMIVGIVSVIGLSIFRFPYAMLIGVVMGITNIIPFFGPFIGAVPGVFILLMINPIRAAWYVLFVIVVQQVDGNIIAPKVIGGSVGLPPLWVLFAVTIGGGLFGVAGMILGTPVFAIIYILLGRATRAREARRGAAG